jgi:hypothetical protein
MEELFDRPEQFDECFGFGRCVLERLINLDVKRTRRA